MRQVFEVFKANFENRYQEVSVLNMGEDSVRYDFFNAIKDSLGLEPWKIQLEYPIHENAFIPRLAEKRKRDEKPQIDLYIDTERQKLSFEFAIFKRNKVDGSPINDTEYGFKILNDFMRLAINSHFTSSDAYFVCVADEMMLGKRLTRTEFPAFPGEQICFNYGILNDAISKYKSGSKIDPRFIHKLEELNLQVHADLIFNERIHSQINPLETRALMWQITSTQLG